MKTTMYECADGTPFPVNWVQPEYEEQRKGQGTRV